MIRTYSQFGYLIKERIYMLLREYKETKQSDITRTGNPNRCYWQESKTNNSQVGYGCKDS